MKWLAGFYISIVILIAATVRIFSHPQNGHTNTSKAKNEEDIWICGNVNDGNYVNSNLLFKAHCATCHNEYKDGTGPALSGIVNRVQCEKWLKAYIRNEDSLIARKDSAAMTIRRKKPTNGPHRFEFTDEQMDEFIVWMRGL